MKFETLAIHAGQEPDPKNGAVMTPVYLTSTYMQDGVGKPREGYEYSRTMHPTRKALQDCLAALEGGNFGLAFASGMAATDTVLRLLDSDSHVLAGNDVYGGTFRLFDKVLRGFNLDFTFADTTDPESVAEALTPSTRLVWLETPTNPLLRITDIKEVADIVHSHENNPLLVVDNTFATPYLQRPLELGADIVVQVMREIVMKKARRVIVIPRGLVESRARKTTNGKRPHGSTTSLVVPRPWNIGICNSSTPSAPSYFIFSSPCL